MGFDQNAPEKPLVVVSKKTTRVNIWIWIGVSIFALVCLGYIEHYRHHPAELQRSAEQPLDHKSQP